MTPWPLSVFTVVLQPLKAARRRWRRTESRMFSHITYFEMASEESSVLIQTARRKSRTKSTGQLAAIDFAPLVHRNLFDKKNPLRDLPSAQTRPAVLEQI